MGTLDLVSHSKKLLRYKMSLKLFLLSFVLCAVQSKWVMVETEDDKVYAEPRNVYEEPAKVYEEPEKVYEEPAKVYEEPEQVYTRRQRRTRGRRQDYESPK